MCEMKKVSLPRRNIMMLHSQRDPANCYCLTKDDLSAGGVIYILHLSHFIPSFAFSMTLIQYDFSIPVYRKGH